MSEIQDFFNQYASVAQQEQQASGLPASVLLAQAALESNYGKSVVGNNLFGIKGYSDNPNEVVWASTMEQDANGNLIPQLAPFRKYDSPIASFADHTSFLQDNPRYAGLFTTKNPYEVTAGLQAAGYATDSHYAEKLNTIIQNNDLTQYDTVQGFTAPAPGDIDYTPPQIHGIYSDNPTVIEDVFGNASDTSRSQAYDRFAALNPPTDIKGIGSFVSGLAERGTVVLVVVVIVILLVVVLLSMFPANPASSIVKGAVQ